MVAFDTRHRGAPDRRLVYGADGAVRVEVDPAGDGHFIEEKAEKGGRPEKAERARR